MKGRAVKLTTPGKITLKKPSLIRVNIVFLLVSFELYLQNYFLKVVLKKGNINQVTYTNNIT